jgi:hypothetical protein
MMRKRLPIVIAASLLASPVMAQSSDPPNLPKPPQPSKTLSRPLPMKGASSASSCTAYGPGFVKVEGTDTCVQIGGAVSIGVGGAIGRR